jgi:uncharacterized iron-regulated protein
MLKYAFIALALIPWQEVPLSRSPAPLDVAARNYTPHRVYDTRTKRFIDFEAMLADVMYSDVVFLGEQHDDPITHSLELATLEGLARRRSNVVLVLEMFERDVQASLDDYLKGRSAEPAFEATARPWPRYDTDYRPMVEFARLWQWPVVAGNIPRRLASLVSRKGLAGLDSLSGADRALVARDINCPHDEYYDRFAKTMADMPSHSGDGAAQTPEQKLAALERVYQAQCVKDETMGEAVAVALGAAPPRALVVHVNGAFHSDYRFGTADRARRRLSGKRISVVSFVPVGDLDKADGAPERKLGDYVVFTLAPPPKPTGPPTQNPR